MEKDLNEYLEHVKYSNRKEKHLRSLLRQYIDEYFKEYYSCGICNFIDLVSYEIENYLMTSDKYDIHKYDTLPFIAEWNEKRKKKEEEFFKQEEIYFNQTKKS